jgi:hypothetical protein
MFLLRALLNWPSSGGVTIPKMRTDKHLKSRSLSKPVRAAYNPLIRMVKPLLATRSFLRKKLVEKTEQ